MTIRPKVSAAKIAPAVNYDRVFLGGEWSASDPVIAPRGRPLDAVFLREYQDFHDRGQ
jgi:hypothetical protein